MYAIWVPSLTADNESRVPAATKHLTDKRVSHYWDEKGKLKKQYQRIMKMDEPAWDVYYLYDRGAEWTDKPPLPKSYMHQLCSLPNERLLDGSKLAEEINKLLNAKKIII